MLIQNIKLMIKKHYVLFMVLMLTQIISVVLLLFSFSVYQNTLYDKKAVHGTVNTICFKIKKANSAEAIKKIKEAFPEISLQLNDSMEAISLFSVLDKGETQKILTENGINNDTILKQIGDRLILYTYPFIKDGKYDAEGWINILASPEKQLNWFTQENYDNAGSNICIAPDFFSDGFVYFDKVKYNIVYNSDSNVIDFCPEDYPEISSRRFDFTVFYDKQLLKSEYYRDVDVILEMLGNEEIEVEDYVTISIENRATWKSMMLISVIMAMASTFIICLIYRFLHKERQKNLAIYELCGCTKPRSALIFLAEAVVYFAVSVTLGVLIYKTIVVKKASVYYLWIKEISSTENIVKLLAVFVPVVLIAIVITVMLSIRKTPREVLRAKE